MTNINSQVIPLRIWLILNQQSKELEEYLSKQLLIRLEKIVLEVPLKKMNSLINDKKRDEALKFLPKLNSELMKIAKTGIIKKQNASRNVSRITKRIASI